MSYELAAAVAGSISAMSSIVQAWKSARDMGLFLTSHQIDDAVRRAKLTDEMIAVLDRVIDDSILDALKKEIEKAKQRLIDAIKDPANTEQAKDNEVSIANSTICRNLKRIRDLNGGTLPGREYEKLWTSHQCA